MPIPATDIFKRIAEDFLQYMELCRISLESRCQLQTNWHIRRWIRKAWCSKCVLTYLEQDVLKGRMF